MKTLNYYKEKKWGRDRWYLKDKEKAALWKKLTGQKTLTTRKVNAFAELTGIDFEQVANTNHNPF